MLIAQGLNPVMHNRLAWIWSNTGIMLKWRSNLNENYEHLQRWFAHVRNEVLISLCAIRFVVQLHRPTCFKVCNTQFALSTAMAKCIRYALPVRIQPWELMCYNLAFADEAFCAKISSKGCMLGTRSCSGIQFWANCCDSSIFCINDSHSSFSQWVNRWLYLWSMKRTRSRLTS